MEPLAFHAAVLAALCLGLSGCTGYRPALVQDGMISNPDVGWNGYSLKVPEGMTLFNPVAADPDSAKTSDFQRWYMREDRRSAALWYVVYTERFLFEHGDDYFISFISETYELPHYWTGMTSVEKQYALQKVANRKAVEINDDDAKREVVDIAGQRAAYVSGESKPYFRRNYTPLAYEGYFILGNMREAFWIEGFGDPGARGELKRKVHELANSLKLH